MFKIGDKVMFDDDKIVGYIVKIEIDPYDETDINDEYVFYTIRVFKDFYVDGYADFTRSEKDMKLYLEPVQLNMFDMMKGE